MLDMRHLRRGFTLGITMLILLLASVVQAKDETTITFAPGPNYFPTQPTPSNPNPPTALTKLVAEYEAAHPGVKIKLVSIPENVSSDTWRVTTFQGGTEPDILPNNYIRVWQEAVNGWYVPLNPYLSQPNPYVPAGMPGHEHWKDEISDVVWNTTLDPANNDQYLVTVDALGTGIFYNKDIFKKVGLPTDLATKTSLWPDWQSMLADMAKLKKAGYEPLALSMSTAAPYNYNWIDGLVLTSVYHDKLPSMFKPGTSWHAMSQEEFACSVQDGIFSAKDPEFSDYIDILSDFEPYWIQGYPTVSPDDAYRLFINGKVPMLLSIASQDMARVIRDATFDFGITYYPPITGATSKYAANVHTSYLVGGPTSGYTVTERAKRDGIVDQAVDFLKFLTAQPQWSRVVSDAPRAVPTVKGLSIPDALKPLTAFLDLPIRAFKDPDPRVSKHYGETHRRLMQEYFTQQISKEQLINQEDRLLRTETQKVIAQNHFDCSWQKKP